MVILIDRLHTNDPELITLSLTSECEPHELSRFLSALGANTTVRHVIFRESFFPLRRIRQHLSFSEFMAFLEAVGRLARDSLTINPSMAGMVRGQLVAAVVFSVLEQLIAHASLTLCSQRDVEYLAEALEECEHLRRVELTELYLVTLRREPMLDPLLHHLSTREHLQVLNLSGGKQDHNFPFLSTEALEILLSSCPTLAYLGICNLGLEDDHFCIIASQLEGNTSLVSLMLHGNHPSLVGIDAILQPLESSNQTLEHVSLICDNTVPVDPSWALPQQVLERNFSLQTLELPITLAEDQQQQVDFLLQLNMVGRKTLLQSTTSTHVGLWPLFLENLNHEPSALYYFLKSSPELVISSGRTSTGT
jgi:hypothetical protein